MRGWIILTLVLSIAPGSAAYAEQSEKESGVGVSAGQASPPGTPPPAANLPAASSSEKTIERDVLAVRLSSPPVIDGDLSDPVWKEASRADRWVDWLNGNANIDQTVVSIGYDEKNLYLAWYAYDSQPQNIVARQTKRGAFPEIGRAHV